MIKGLKGYELVKVKYLSYASNHLAWQVRWMRMHNRTLHPLPLLANIP